MTVLDFVRGSEYRKQVARNVAAALAGRIEIDALLAGGGAYAERLVDDLLGDLIEEVIRQAVRDARSHAGALGLAALTGTRLDATVDAAVTRVLEEAITGLGEAVEAAGRSVLRMQAAGVADSVIARALSADAGGTAILAPVVAVLRSTGAGLVNAVEGAVLTESAIVLTEQEPEEVLFAWQTREDDKVCEDVFENSCAPRHGQDLTLEEWEAFGLPQSENMICGMFAKGSTSNCRCVLENANNESRSPSPIKVADAVKAGREQADAEFPEAA